jgi:hypothetical protein
MVPMCTIARWFWFSLTRSQYRAMTGVGLWLDVKLLSISILTCSANRSRFWARALLFAHVLRWRRGLRVGYKDIARPRSDAS